MTSARGSGTSARERSPDRLRERRVLSVTTLGILIVSLNGSALNVALPAMSDHFGAAPDVANWFLLAFMLTSTASILVLGRLSDLVGRKRLYIGGLLLFALLNVLCVVIPGQVAFIVLRALQGVAVATTVTITPAIVADNFSGTRLAYGLGMNTTAASIGATIGPSVGGLLVTHLDWRAIFLISVPIALLATVLGARHIPDRRPERTAGMRFDYTGAVLSCVGLGLLLYGLNSVSAPDSSTPETLLTAGAGLLLLALFVVVERRVRAPVVDLRLIRGRARSLAYAATFFNAVPRTGVAVLIVLHQQVVAGRSAAGAGTTIVAFAVAMIVGASSSGRLATRFTSRLLLTFSGVLMFAGMLALVALLGPDAPPVPTGLALVVAGLGAGVFTPANSASIMSGVAPGERAVANGVRAMLLNLAGAVSTVVILVIVTSSFAPGATYASVGPSPDVVFDFRIAALVLALCAGAAAFLSACRGGPGRPGRTTPAASLPATPCGRPPASGVDDKTTGPSDIDGLTDRQPHRLAAERGVNT